MKPIFYRIATSLLLLLGLAACFEPDTPQETAAAFWEAVSDNDARGAVKYSTLESVKDYDGFGQKWEGMKPVWKRVVIEGSEASIETEFTRSGTPATQSKNVMTYLVMKDGVWKVDYARTSEGMQGGVFAAIFGELGKLGQQISAQLTASSQNMQSDLDELRREMETYSASFSTQASELIERYGEALRRSIDELAASAREASQANSRQLTEKDRRVLDETAEALETQSDELSEPTSERVMAGTANAANAQQKLITINGDAMEKYKRQWMEWKARFEAQLQQFLDDLNASLASEGNQEE